MVELENISCNNCGAPLEVPDTVSFVTCNHCNTRLAIRRTESTTFTEKLESIESQQNEMLEKLANLERQNELMRIDRNWEKEKESYMIRGKDGHVHEPSEAGVIMPLIGGVAALVISIFISLQNPVAIFFGIIALCVGGGISFFVAERMKEFRRAKKRYRQRRVRAARLRPLSEIEDELKDVKTPIQFLDELESK